MIARARKDDATCTRVRPHASPLRRERVTRRHDPTARGLKNVHPDHREHVVTEVGLIQAGWTDHAGVSQYEYVTVAPFVCHSEGKFSGTEYSKMKRDAGNVLQCMSGIDCWQASGHREHVITEIGLIQAGWTDHAGVSQNGYVTAAPFVCQTRKRSSGAEYRKIKRNAGNGLSKVNSADGNVLLGNVWPGSIVGRRYPTQSLTAYLCAT